MLDIKDTLNEVLLTRNIRKPTTKKGSEPSDSERYTDKTTYRTPP